MNSPQTSSARPALSNSLFHMWRAIVAIAHTDGVLHADERKYFDKIFSGLERAHGMTQEQKAILVDDLAYKKDIAGLIPHITDRADRGQLIYFAGLLARSDGNFDATEESILAKLRTDHMGSADYDSLRREIHDKVSSAAFKEELAVENNRMETIFGRVLDSVLLRFGIDILE